MKPIPAAVTLPKRSPRPRARPFPRGQSCQLCLNERAVTTVANFRIGAGCRKRLRAIAHDAGVDAKV